jgi:hypothetical protein
MGVEGDRLGVAVTMVCRNLRSFLNWRLPLIVPVCLAMLGRIAIPPPAVSADQVPSLTIRAPEFPLAALAETAGIRIEKQAQSQRPSIRKLDRASRLIIAVVRHRGPRLNVRIQHVFRNLPRRQLHAMRLTPSSSDDPSSPLLS